MSEIISWSSGDYGSRIGQVGTCAGTRLLDYAPSSEPADFTFPEVAPAIPEEAIQARYLPDGRWLLRFPLAPDERIFGLGLHYASMNRRERVYHLKVDHYGGKDSGSTHAPVPFYLSDRGYGVFINSLERLSVYCGTTHLADHHPALQDRVSGPWRPVAVSDAIEIVVPGAGVEVMLFPGPGMLDTVQRFNLTCGGGCLPPKWGLGFWHRVPMVYTAENALGEAEEFRSRAFPLDVIGLEPGWHSGSYPTTFAWDSGRFPDPDGFLDALSENGVHTNLWENPYVSPACALGRDLAGHCGDYTGGWGGLVPDLNDPGAVRILSEQHDREHLSRGVSGYKLDECDGYDQWLWPDHAMFPSGLTGAQLRQIYGLLFQKVTGDMFRRRGRRTYGLVRASNAGSVSLPYVIYNDCYNHREYIAGLCNASLCGVLFTPEARGSRSSEEWLRRIQAVCMSPLAMINAWADGTKPWSFPDVADEVREVMRLRLRLLPYLYTAFAEYRRTGKPPFRAMILEPDFGLGAETFEAGVLDSTANPYSDAVRKDVLDQYMMGADILVAPLFAGETERRVILPRGRWYDFYTGSYAGNGEVIRIPGTTRRIPLFVRDGGIVPLLANPTFDRVPAGDGELDLEIRYYGERVSESRLYDDDGETFAFEAGESVWISLRVDRDVSGHLCGRETGREGSYRSPYRVSSWTFMSVSEDGLSGDKPSGKKDEQ